jgi:hypothetical protein
MENYKNVIIAEIGDIDNYTTTRKQINEVGISRMQEVRQLIENGIPIISLIREKLSILNGAYISIPETIEKLKKGQINAGLTNEILTDYFND